MNLKESFRYQNKFRQLIDEAEYILREQSNITKVKNTYLRKKVMPEAENETTYDVPNTEYGGQITQIVRFLMFLLNSREALSKEIRKAKSALELDMDSEISLNADRQRAASILSFMNGISNSETVAIGGGTGYRFNADGNQVAYKCDVERVITINFDRNEIKKLLAELNEKSDEISAQLDCCLINSKVEFTPLFNVNSSFDEVFKQFAENN